MNVLQREVNEIRLPVKELALTRAGYYSNSGGNTVANSAFIL